MQKDLVDIDGVIKAEYEKSPKQWTMKISTQPKNPRGEKDVVLIHNILQHLGGAGWFQDSSNEYIVDIDFFVLKFKGEELQGYEPNCDCQISFLAGVGKLIENLPDSLRSAQSKETKVTEPSAPTVDEIDPSYLDPPSSWLKK